MSASTPVRRGMFLAVLCLLCCKSDKESKTDAVDFLQEAGSLSKTWGFFRTARNRSTDPAVQTQWDNAGTLGVRCGQEKAKREMLLAWLGDTTFKTLYFDVTNNISQMKQFKTTDQWMTRKEVVTKYGKSQAKQMMKREVFTTRNDPQCPQFLQYLVRKQLAETSVARGKTAKLTSGDKVKASDRLSNFCSVRSVIRCALRPPDLNKQK